MVAGAVGNNQDFQQSKSGRNQLLAAFIDFSEERQEQRKKLGMFFDEVDEDRGVHADRAAADIGHQSHEARSRSTWAEASIPFQCSLPNPWRSRIDSGFGASRTSERIWVTSCAIDRCLALGPSCHLLKRELGKPLNFKKSTSLLLNSSIMEE